MVYTQQRGKGDFPWRVFFKKPDGSLTSASGFSSQEAAEDHGRLEEAKGRAGTWVDPRKAATPFADWSAAWLAHRTVAPATSAKWRRIHRDFLLPRWRTTALGEFNRYEVRTWASSLPVPEDRRTDIVSVLSMMLTSAFEAGMIGGNPIFRLQLSEAGDQYAQAIETERIWAYPEYGVELAARLWPEDRVGALMVLLASFTSMRYGETTGLHRDNTLVEHLDMSTGRPYRRTVIRIDPKVGALHEVPMLEHEDPDDETSPMVERVKLFLGPPKPPNGARYLDVIDPLATLLQFHLKIWKHPLVCCGIRGGYMRRSNFARRTMRPACDGRPEMLGSRGHKPKEGWPALLPGLELHGLRHGHETAMVEDGVPRKLRLEQMGHQRKPENEDIDERYQHITPVMRQKRLAALTERFEKGRAELATDPWEKIL